MCIHSTCELIRYEFRGNSKSLNSCGKLAGATSNKKRLVKVHSFLKLCFLESPWSWAPLVWSSGSGHHTWIKWFLNALKQLDVWVSTRKVCWEKTFTPAFSDIQFRWRKLKSTDAFLRNGYSFWKFTSPLITNIRHVIFVNFLNF